jgi:hypothetical protein
MKFKDELVSFDTAKLAKEKGFDIRVEKMYATQSIPQLEDYCKDTYEIWAKDCCLAPTQSLLQRWLREEYNIAVLISFNDNSEFEYYYFIHTNVSKKYSNRICSLSLEKRTFKTYEEALEVGLQESLKLVVQTDKKLTKIDLSILKYYKLGNELCGFEGVHDNLVSEGYLDGDLEVTKKCIDFFKSFQNWDSIEMYNNTMKITIG